MTDFFVVGGTLRPNAPSYVKRPADDELPALIRAGRFTYILTARQMGKSSLIIRTAYRLRKEGIQTVLIDLTALGSSSSEEKWYFALLKQLVRDLRLTVDLNAWWDAQRVGMVPRFIGFLEDVVLSERQETVVIFVDEIDVTLSLPFSDDFFAAIRALHNARAQNPNFDRLTFVLAGVAAPTDLIKDRTRTPFNVGQGLPLQDFSRTDAQALQKGLEQASLSEAESLFTHIYHWTDGHPYLTQKLCQAIIEQPPEHCSHDEINKLVERLFLSEKSIKEDNLRYVQDKLLSHPQQRRLLRLYRQIYDGKQVPDDPQSLHQSQLKLSGLVKTENGHLKVRNEIYRHVFDLVWINAHTAIDWVRIVATGAVLLVVVLLGLLGQSTWAGMRDRDIRAEFHEANTTATRKIELLHELFGLQAYIPGADYDYRAKELFYSLSRDEQLALFESYTGQEADLALVVEGLYITLADVDQSDSTGPLLEAMVGALDRLDSTPQTATLQNEIESWLQGRAFYRQAQYAEARTRYDQALALNGENPATLYERARVLTKLLRYEEALGDLERVLAIAQNVSVPTTPTPTMTSTLTQTIYTPTSTATPSLVITPTPSPTTLISETVTITLSPVPTETPTPVLSAITSEFDTPGKMGRTVEEFILAEPELLNALATATDSQYTNLRDVVPTPTAIPSATQPLTPLNILLPLTGSPTLTLTTSPTSVPNNEPTPVTPTRTSVPNNKPTLVTPTSTPSPAAPPTGTQIPAPPTGTQIPALPTLTSTPILTVPPPVLLAPEDNISISQPTLLEWSWNGTLQEDEWFEVRIWREEELGWGSIWTKETSYDFDPNVRATGHYFWSIAVILQSNGVWEANLSEGASPRRLEILVPN